MKIIPVIHVINENQVRTNVETIISCGLDSVFLINHQNSVMHLINIGIMVQREFPDLWVGINMLGIPIEQAVEFKLSFDALWCDETATQEGRDNRVFDGLLFTGYNFKYQPKSKESLKELSKFTDVLVTSGAGTNKETPLSKVKMMKEQTNTPIAIASGVNKNNIKNYKNYVDYILVASSITSASEIIDKSKLEELIEASK